MGIPENLGASMWLQHVALPTCSARFEVWVLFSQCRHVTDQKFTSAPQAKQHSAAGMIFSRDSKRFTHFRGQNTKFSCNTLRKFQRPKHTFSQYKLQHKEVCEEQNYEFSGGLIRLETPRCKSQMNPSAAGQSIAPQA